MLDCKPQSDRLLAAALKAARAGDTLVIWRLDRLGRSRKELLARADELKHYGIQLRSLTQHINTSTPGGELIFHMFGARICCKVWSDPKSL
jgi:DNA invertase Pin-like site-specific DNA recombinase